MESETVYRFQKYDIKTDDFVVSTRMATAWKIRQLGAELLPETETEVDAKLVKDGWTAKDFMPEEHATPHMAAFQSQVR